MKKSIFIIIGSLSLILGILGIFLPILPTTPLLLLSAYLYARSSIKLHSWLINHRVFGTYISNFQDNKIIPRKVKIYTLSALWITMIISIFTAARNILWLQLLLVAIAIGVTIHILSYKSE